MFIEYNPSPVGARVGDCSVRAVAKALDTTWENAYLMIAVQGYQMYDVISANSVWGNVLRQHGFQRFNLPTDCPDCYTVRDFCEDHPNGTYVLGTGNHVVTAVDGDYFDTWDSGNEIVAYVWHKKGDFENGNV